MTFSINTENEMVKWLFAEALMYRNNSKPIFNSDGYQWATKTRIQKIIFTILDNFEIPVTHSWYMWGGFIHSPVLEGQSFGQIRSFYSKNPDKVGNLRTKMEKMGLPVNDILDDLQDNVDYVLKFRSSEEFLPVYYKNEAPEEYKDVYVSKQELTTLFSKIGKSILDERIIPKKLRVNQELSNFHKASFNVFENEVLEECSLRFADLVESALEKIVINVNERNKNKQYVNYLFFNAKKIFDSYIWNPYACEISVNTVKGDQSNQVSRNMEFRKTKLISECPQSVDHFEIQTENKNIKPTWKELRNSKTKSKNHELNQILSQIFEIYDLGSEAGE